MSLESPQVVQNAAELTQVVQNQEEQYRIEKAKSRILKNGSIGSSSYQEIALGFSLGAVKNHSVGQLAELVDGSLLVQGMVRHTHGDHKQLALQKGIWYKALQNLAVRAWSSSGRRGLRID